MFGTPTRPPTLQRAGAAALGKLLARVAGSPSLYEGSGNPVRRLASRVAVPGPSWDRRASRGSPRGSLTGRDGFDRVDFGMRLRSERTQLPNQAHQRGVAELP